MRGWETHKIPPCSFWSDDLRAFFVVQASISLFCCKQLNMYMGMSTALSGALNMKIDWTFVTVISIVVGKLEWTYVIVKETHALVLWSILGGCKLLTVSKLAWAMSWPIKEVGLREWKSLLKVKCSNIPQYLEYCNCGDEDFFKGGHIYA